MSRIFRVNIAFGQTGAGAAATAVRGISSAAQESNNAVRALKATFLSIVSREAVQEIARLGDEILRLRNRLSFVTGDATKVGEAFRLIQDAADETRGGLAATGDLYTRFALATRHMGLEAKEVVGIVKTLNEIVILSGSNAREAEQGLLQFSQGLASDRLAGDELRAVLEQIPLLSDVIGKQLGVTRGALRFLAREGQISGKVVVDALRNVSDEMRRNFAGTVITISQAATILHNSFLRVLDDIDKSNGLFGRMSGIILFISRNTEFFGRVILAGVLVVSIYAVVTAVKALTIALLANPLGALILVITSATALLITFADQIIVLKEEGATLADVLVSAFQAIRAELEPLLVFAFSYFQDNILPVLKELPGAVAEQLKTTARDVASFYDLIQNGFNGLGAALGAGFVVIVDSFTAMFARIRNLGVDIAEFFRDIFFGVFEGLLKGIAGVVQKIFDASKLLKVAFDSLTAGDFSTAILASGAAVESLKGAFASVPLALSDSLVSQFSEDNFKKYRRPVIDSAKTLGQALSEGFTQGFSENGEPALAFVNGVISTLEGKVSGLQNAFERITRATIDGAIKRARERSGAIALGDGSFPASQGDEGLKNLGDVVRERAIAKLKEETEALSQDNRERRVQTELLVLENYLRSNKGTTSPEQELDIEILVRRKDAFKELQKVFQEYQQVLPNTAQGFADLTEVEDELVGATDSLLTLYRVGFISHIQLNQLLETQRQKYLDVAQVLRDIQDPAEAYRRKLEAIAKASQYARTETEKLKLEQEKSKALLQSLEGVNTPEAGIARGFLKLAEEIQDTSKLIQQSIENAFHGAEDALIDFIVNGKRSFSDLANSILSDLVRIGLRQFITGPLLGLLQGGISSAFTPRAGGGPVQSGVNYLVGEEGPELVRFGQSGRVINSEETRQVVNGRGGGGDGGNQFVNVQMTVVTPDVDSFRRSKDQTARQLGSALQRLR